MSVSVDSNIILKRLNVNAQSSCNIHPPQRFLGPSFQSMSCTVHPQFPQSDYLGRVGICGVSMEQATRNGNEHFKAEKWWLEYNLPFGISWEGNHCIYPTSFHIQALAAHTPVQTMNDCFTWQSQCPESFACFGWNTRFCSSKVVKKHGQTTWKAWKNNENSRVNMMTSDHGYCGIHEVRIFQECTKSTAKTMPKASAYNSHQASWKATFQQCQQSQALKSYIFHLNFHGIVGGCIAPLTQSCFCQIIRNH